MKRIWNLFLCYLLINSVHGRYLENGELEFTSNLESDEELDATFADFKNRHIVGSIQSSVADWNILLRNRIGGLYGTKAVNTFVVNSDSVIAANFPTTVPKYTGGTADNLYWSSTTQRVFVMTKSGPKYNVYDCGQKYYVAGIDLKTRKPIHYQGHGSTQGGRLDPVTAGCTRLTIVVICEKNEMNQLNCKWTIGSGYTHHPLMLYCQPDDGLCLVVIWQTKTN